MTVLAMSIRGLSVELGSEEVLHSVDLDVPDGGSIGIVGESGCGKSTLLRCVAGIERHWTGSVKAFGQPLGQRRSLADRQRVQMVFQDPIAALNPAHTVDDILREPLAIHGFGDREQRIMRAIDSVALPASVRFRFPFQLSGGQRQRVCIARALLVEPRLLLLDEPTSALDVSVQAEILNLLSQLRASQGISYVLVSHDIAVVSHMCERIAVMDAGAVVRSFDRSEIAHLTPREAYRSLLRPAETVALG